MGSPSGARGTGRWRHAPEGRDADGVDAEYGDEASLQR